MGIFDTQKMLMCTLFWGGGSQKVYGVCTLMKMLTFMDGPLGSICLILAGGCGQENLVIDSNINYNPPLHVQNKSTLPRACELDVLGLLSVEGSWREFDCCHSSYMHT